MKNFTKMRIVALAAICAFLAGACGGGGGSGNVQSPAEAGFAAQALEDVSVLDVAGLGIANPPGFSPMLSRPLTSVSSAAQAQDLQPGDPRWIWQFNPRRPRGEDDELPAATDPLRAARYILATQPACATITSTGTCPPDTLTVNSSCTDVIVFDPNGCAVSASVGKLDETLFLTGTLVHTVTITQAGTWPAVQGVVEVSTTDFHVSESAEEYVDYSGTIMENYDGTAPANGFTVTHVSPNADPMSFTGPDGFRVTVEGQRVITVIPQISVNINANGTVTLDPPDRPPLPLDVTTTKTITAGPSSVNITIDRAVFNTITQETHSRTADITLTPSDNPVTEVVINGQETFSGPLVSVTVDIIGVAVDLNCVAPRAGQIVVTTPNRAVTIVFDNNCNCFANWFDNLGNSGTLNFCEERREK